MGNAEPIYYSADMVRALNVAVEPDGWPRYETVYGELLVTTAAPRPLHQRVVRRLVVALANYLEREHVGEVFSSPSDISFGLLDVLVQPDVFVVPIETARAFDTGRAWDAVGRLVMACEVLSPSTKRRDRFTKRRLYQDRGTPLYWIVDVDERTVEVWTPADDFPRFERERLAWHPDGATAPFALGLDELFAEG